VVLMGADPERSRRRREALGPMLGGEARIAEVEAVLQRRAREWAQAAAADGTVVEAGRGGVLPAGEGPTLLVWPELPVWMAGAGTAALEDLAAGCAASIGPVFEGELYLLAFADPIPGLTDGPAPVPRMGEVFRIVEQRGLEVGLLRAERGLREPDDVRALLADPTTDAELLGLLG
jgi:hypothetical protein